MQVFISGGTGFVGQNLSRHLLHQGHKVVATGRRATQLMIDHPSFQYISADTTQPGSWQQSVTEAEWVINLAGKSIFGRWNSVYKEELQTSRLLTTRNIVEAISAQNPPLFFSASAVGYYGGRSDSIITEDTTAADDFLGRLAVKWERAAMSAKEKGCRVVLTRFGVVLGKNGGAFKQMATPFKWFVGGPMSNGQQWFPWIHVADLINAIEYIAKRKELDGAFNFSAPQPVRNGDMAKALGKALSRPTFVPAPAMMLRLALGEFAETLLVSQRVIPQRLLDAGFKFRFNDIETALKDLVR